MKTGRSRLEEEMNDMEQTPSATGDGQERNLEQIAPPMILEELRKGVLGQNTALRFVSVALFKHTTGKVPGNILLIGNSGTGKTTIMNNIQRMYHEVPEYRPFRAMTIINANLLVDAERMEFQPERLLVGGRAARRAPGRAAARRRTSSGRPWSGRPSASTRSTRCRQSSPANPMPSGWCSSRGC